jgi:hypothetical protein
MRQAGEPAASVTILKFYTLASKKASKAGTHTKNGPRTGERILSTFLREQSLLSTDPFPRRSLFIGVEYPDLS